MLIAIFAACGLWGFSWMMGKKLDSAWGVLLPCAAMPCFALWERFSQWRIVMIVAMLLTVVILFHVHGRLRHYLLLPSCFALAGA